MEKKTWKITLADGSVLEDLQLNGNNFISARRVQEEDFGGSKLDHVIIDGPDGEHEEHDNMALVQITEVNADYWFVLREYSAQEIWQAKINSNVEYIAMMADINLEEV